jgi:hypothetical protein
VVEPPGRLNALGHIVVKGESNPSEDHGLLASSPALPLVMLETKIEEPLQVAFPLPAGLFQQLEVT